MRIPTWASEQTPATHAPVPRRRLPERCAPRSSPVAVATPTGPSVSCAWASATKARPWASPGLRNASGGVQHPLPQLPEAGSPVHLPLELLDLPLGLLVAPGLFERSVHGRPVAAQSRCELAQRLQRALAGRGQAGGSRLADDARGRPRPVHGSIPGVATGGSRRSTRRLPRRWRSCGVQSGRLVRLRRGDPRTASSVACRSAPPPLKRCGSMARCTRPRTSSTGRPPSARWMPSSAGLSRTQGTPSAPD